MWAFKQLWDKGLVYEGFRVVPYSWAAQTPLSHFETRLDNSYRMRQDPALTVTFQLHPKHGESDRAEASRLDDDAVDAAVQPGARGRIPRPTTRVMEKGGEQLDPRRRLARALRHGTRELRQGRHDQGCASWSARRYEPLFPFFADEPRARSVVVGGDFIELGEGTGVVHMAPAFGEDDLAVG